MLSEKWFVCSKCGKKPPEVRDFHVGDSVVCFSCQPQVPPPVTAIGMDVNSMPAGPELDALVAEKVMGYTSWAFGVPRYSTSLEAAWEVVEKMKPVWGKFRLSYGPYLVVKGKLKDGWELEPAWCSPICGYGETAPMAICRAAINARQITK